MLPIKPIVFSYPQEALHQSLDTICSEYQLVATSLFKSYKSLELVKIDPSKHQDIDLRACLMRAANQTGEKKCVFKDVVLAELELINSDSFALFARTVLGLQTTSTRIKKTLLKLPLLTQGAKHSSYELCHLKTDVWFEKLHKDHPCGKDIFEFFTMWSRNSKISCSFDDYLALRPSIVEKLPQVAYLDETKRKRFEVFIKDGRVENVSGPFNTDSIEHKKHALYAIFVISSDLKFYIGPYINGYFHHSSFLSGAPVIGAGEIKTDATGTITHLSKDSGHYDPSDKHFEQTIDFLRSQGIDISKITLF